MKSCFIEQIDRDPHFRGTVRGIRVDGSSIIVDARLPPELTRGSGRKGGKGGGRLVGRSRGFGHRRRGGIRGVLSRLVG